MTQLVFLLCCLLIMKLNKPHLIRSARLAFAMLTGIIVAKILHIGHPLWLFITLVVVLFDQSTVGGAVFRGVLRVSATLAGAVIGFLVLIIFKNNIFINDITVIIGTVIFAYFFMDSKYSYIGTLGSITLIMVLANDFGNNVGLDVPLLRVIAIITGTIVAVISMIVFFPRFAGKQIKQQIIDYLEKMESTIKVFINLELSVSDIQEYFLTHEIGLTGGIIKFNRLADEVRFEAKLKVNYSLVSLHIRRINRLLHVVFLNLPNNDIRYNPELRQELTRLADMFHKIRDGIVNKSNINGLKLDYLDNIKNEDTTINNHELIFIYSTFNRIISETNILVEELQKISLLV